VTYYGDFAGDEYQNQTAKEKRDLLWGKVLKNTESAYFSDYEIAELFAESMHPSFDTYRDDLVGMVPLPLSF
jgi:hypothetical protein